MPDNVTSMVYNLRNGPPWHGKGTPVNGLSTAADCIKEAGLDWAVAKVPVKIADDGSLPVPGCMVTVRTDLPSWDPKRILGVVGEEYSPLQNWEAFSFFDRIVGEGIAIYETAGAIENGKRIWLLASLPDWRIEPVRGDRIDSYLLLANGHDGQLMVHVKFTPVRVVCQNTLATALIHASGPHMAFRHDRSLKRKLYSAAELLADLKATGTLVRERWARMAETAFAAADAERYFLRVFDRQSGADEARGTRPGGLAAKAMENFLSPANRELGIADSLWAAYNGAVWAVDFARTSRKDRVDDLCLGEGARLKQRAFDIASELLEARV